MGNGGHEGPGWPRARIRSPPSNGAKAKPPGEDSGRRGSSDMARDDKEEGFLAGECRRVAVPATAPSPTSPRTSTPARPPCPASGSPRRPTGTRPVVTGQGRQGHGLKFRAPMALSEYQLLGEGGHRGGHPGRPGDRRPLTSEGLLRRPQGPGELTQGDRPRFSAQVHHVGVIGGPSRSAWRSTRASASRSTPRSSTSRGTASTRSSSTRSTSPTATRSA